MLGYLKAIINSYADVLFLKGLLPGGVLFLITFFNPNIALSGLICIISAYFFALFLGFKEEFLRSGFFTYNPLLVGLSIGYLFKLNWLTIVFIINAGVLCFIVTYALHNMFSYYLKLPVLSLPFVIISSLAYLAASQYSNLYVNTLYPHAHILKDIYPKWISGPAQAIGAIFFIPQVEAGLIIWALLFLCSRILFFQAITGYITGIMLLSIFYGSTSQALSDINAFNFILIGIGIGSVFLIPSPKSYLISIIAVAASSLLLEAVKSVWYIYRLPVFTLPFNVISLSFLYILKLLQSPYLVDFYQNTPENTLDYYLTFIKRFPGTERTICLPFSGEWTVSQGMNGEWTHKGVWQYAVDFVITDENGNSYTGNGTELKDYYCFGKPVLSPISGTVAKVVDNIPDNKPGIVNKEKNWGNLVLIYDERGFYVLLCHLLKGSVKVREGEIIERGKEIGLCGSSGYSPYPHLHVHVQLNPVIGAPTVPFSFVQYMDSENNYYANNIPKKGQKVIPLYPEVALDTKMTFLLEEEMKFCILENENSLQKEVTLKTKMNERGEFYFEIGNTYIYFSKWMGTFYMYRVDGKIDDVIEAFFVSLPRLPLTYKEGLKWKDYIPVSVVVRHIKKHFILFLSSFLPAVTKIKGSYKFVSPDEIKGEIYGFGEKMETYVKLHPLKGWEEIVLKKKNKKITLRRIEE